MIFGGYKKDLEYFLTIKDIKLPKDVVIGAMLPSFHWKFVWYKMLRCTTYRVWTGTDIYKARHYWHYRLRVSICNLFIDKHYFISEGLRNEFMEGFPRQNIATELWGAIVRPYERKFNVLVYIPKVKRTKKLRTKIYGIDIFEEMRKKYHEWNWMVLDGTIPKEIARELYSVSDVLFRPTRHDGDPRMVLEARMHRVPVIWAPDKMNEYYAEERLKEEYDKWQTAALI